jgi:cysteinyl-tRNA synthetase
MSCATLGETFDIHGGGEDLQFPHHENEIAQSEGAHGKPMASYWMHNGFLNVDNTKMSKSLNNFFTIRDVLKDYAPEVIRFFMLRTHYRSQFNYADTLVADAKGALTRLYIALNGVTPDSQALDWSEPFAARFADAMCDDFNTPVALAVMFEMSTELNKNKSPALARQLRGLGAVLGVLGAEPALFLKGDAGADDAEIDALVAARTAAKKAKNFAESDRIRNDLQARGITLEDSAAGTSWRRA